VLPIATGSDAASSTHECEKNSMNRVFKVFQDSPRSLIDYERIALQELSPLGIEEAMEEGDSVRESILAEARQEAEEKVKEAYAEGLRRGMETGLARFQASVSESAEALRQAASAMEAARAAFLDSLEPQVVDLAVAMAERILQREAETDPELIGRVVREALEHLMDRERVRVRVNPEDLEAMRAYKVTLLDDFEGVNEIQVQEDASIAPGGCIIESELMQVDARLETQFAQIVDAVTRAPAPGEPE
jgi:flagellar assembly protein FliH